MYEAVVVNTSAWVKVILAFTVEIRKSWPPMTTDPGPVLVKVMSRPLPVDPATAVTDWIVMTRLAFAGRGAASAAATASRAGSQRKGIRPRGPVKGIMNRSKVVVTIATQCHPRDRRGCWSRAGFSL